LTFRVHNVPCYGLPLHAAFPARRPVAGGKKKKAGFLTPMIGTKQPGRGARGQPRAVYFQFSHRTTMRDPAAAGPEDRLALFLPARRRNFRYMTDRQMAVNGKRSTIHRQGGGPANVHDGGKRLLPTRACRALAGWVKKMEGTVTRHQSETEVGAVDMIVCFRTDPATSRDFGRGSSCFTPRAISFLPVERYGYGTGPGGEWNASNRAATNCRITPIRTLGDQFSRDS